MLRKYKKIYVKFINRLHLLFYQLFFPSNLKIEGSCGKCGVCCQKIYILIDFKGVINEDEFYKMQRDIPSYRYLEIAGKDSSGEIFFSCRLFKDNQCSKYKQRPLICRKYPSVSMLKYGGILNKSCSYKLAPRKSFEFYLKKSNLL